MVSVRCGGKKPQTVSSGFSSLKQIAFKEEQRRRSFAVKSNWIALSQFLRPRPNKTSARVRGLKFSSRAGRAGNQIVRACFASVAIFPACATNLAPDQTDWIFTSVSETLTCNGILASAG